MQPSSFKNVWILTAVNALAFSATPMMLLIGSLVGSKLAASAQLATLPLAMVVVGAAAGVIPASILMKRLGRKVTLFLYIALGIITCLLAGESLAAESFWGFNGACFLLGITNSALQQVRFAAMESVSPKEAAKAASIIMSGGILAAIIGPELAVIGSDITSVEYQGSFYLVALCLLIAGAILIFFTNPRMINSAQPHKARPISDILNNPNFCLAVASSVVGYFVMSFIMTGTPISMHNHHGYSLEDTKWVIQSHIVAMFLPSLIAPQLFKWFGIRRLMMTGLFLFSLTIVIGLADSSTWGYWVQLIFLGVGWNFLFLSGTSLLPSTYNAGEQHKAQAFNDSLVFGMQAIAALTAGVAIVLLSWQGILLLCLAPMSLMFILLIKTR